MIGRPPMHVLTNPRAFGLESTGRIVVFGERVVDSRGREMVFAGTTEEGKPFLLPMEKEWRQAHVLDRLTQARNHHESGGDR
jgi:hypothetical protein